MPSHVQDFKRLLFNSKNDIFKSMWPEGAHKITEITKRPQTAGTLFKVSRLTESDSLIHFNTKESLIHLNSKAPLHCHNDYSLTELDAVADADPGLKGALLRALHQTQRGQVALGLRRQEG